MHHPWRAFRALADWTLHWAHLPDGILGYTDHVRKTVTLTQGMTQVERRCTIEHERQHVLRGPVPWWRHEREERQVDEAAARKLIAFDKLVDAVMWSADEHEVADLLWVDVPTVVTRLTTLSVAESDEMLRRLNDAEMRHP